MLVREISHNECMGILAEQHIARLACAKDNMPYVIPIQYAYASNRCYVFTMPGKKLDYLRANPQACLQIDKYHDKDHWISVVADASFRELPEIDPPDPERLQAWSLLSDRFDWWEPGAIKPSPQPTTGTSPHVFFALDIINVSGREASPGDRVIVAH